MKISLVKYSSKPLRWWLSTPLYAKRLLLARLVELLPSNGKLILSRRVFGYVMRLDLKEGIQNSIFNDSFEPVETSWVQNYLKPGMTFIDVGANVGYFSFLAARSVGSRGRVISFEPSPYAYEILQRVVVKNGISQVTPVQAGLGDSHGQLPLMLQKEELHSPSLLLESGIPLGTVPVLLLDEYLTEHHIKRVDLVKIDVEGYEPNVVRGMERAMRSGRIHAILCELNDGWLIHNKTNSSELRRLIESYGFKVRHTIDYTSHQDIFFEFDARFIIT